MELEQLVMRNRSYRRFDESVAIPLATVESLVGLARRTPSGMNRQPLKYAISVDREMNAKIFQTLKWAGALKDWDGPAEGERPAGYVIVLTDTQLSPKADTDIGIAAQTICLGAVAAGYGACMIGSVNRKELGPVLGLPPELALSLVIGLGKPAEKVILEDAPSPDSVTYYRDDNDDHHVPKRPLDEILVARWG
jgi:nitroreductase